MVTTGIKGRREQTVTPEMSAARVESVLPYLDEGQGTVGTLVNVAHTAATPIGMRVWCESELVEVDRRKLVFKVKAFDECDLIGEGFHERFIIDTAKFFEKVSNKKAGASR